MIIIYKIQRDDGLFSLGGEYPFWSEKGRTWNNRASVSSHIKQTGFKYPSDAVIVEVEAEIVKSTKYKFTKQEVVWLNSEKSQ